MPKKKMREHICFKRERILKKKNGSQKVIEIFREIKKNTKWVQKKLEIRIF